ncbi:MAG TPA: DUF1579 family protein [Polyangia bacterium]
MTKTTTLLATALMAVSSIALAQTPKPAPAAAPKAGAMAAPAAPAAPEAAAAAAPMGPPKPAPENDMFKKVAGTWHCDATGKNPDGKDTKSKTTWTWKSVLGGHWYTVVYKSAKSGPMPAFEGNATMGFNVPEKNYWFVGVDNMGGWINLSSTDGMAYAGEGLPMGKKGPMKITFAKGKDKKGAESDKLMDVTLDFGGMISNQACKK